MHKSKDVYLYMDIFTYYKSIGLFNFIKQYINHVDVECIDHEWDNEFSYICDMSCQPAHVHLQGTKNQGSQDSIAPASCENSDLALLMQTSWNSWLTSHLNLHCMGMYGVSCHCCKGQPLKRSASSSSLGSQVWI